MISKHFSIMCDQCTTSEGLFSTTLKECELEAVRLGWRRYKGIWLCENCLEELGINI